MAANSLDGGSWAPLGAINLYHAPNDELVRYSLVEQFAATIRLRGGAVLVWELPESGHAGGAIPYISHVSGELAAHASSGLFNQ